MKTLLLSLFIGVSFTLTSCKKDDNSGNTPTPTSAIEGKWRYDSNINGFCGEDMFGEIMEVKSGVATILSVPSNAYGWKAGQQTLSEIAQTTSPNNFTASGYSQAAGGAVLDRNINVKLAVSSNANSLTVTYTNVCNPVQIWSKAK